MGGGVRKGGQTEENEKGGKNKNKMKIFKKQLSKFQMSRSGSRSIKIYTKYFLILVPFERKKDLMCQKCSGIQFEF